MSSAWSATKEEAALETEEEAAPKKKKFYKGWGVGIIDDYKRTIRVHWCGEMTNFSLKTVAVGFFLFFACIAPAM